MALVVIDDTTGNAVGTLNPDNSITMPDGSVILPSGDVLSASGAFTPQLAHPPGQGSGGPSSGASGGGTKHPDGSRRALEDRANRTGKALDHAMAGPPKPSKTASQLAAANIPFIGGLGAMVGLIVKDVGAIADLVEKHNPVQEMSDAVTFLAKHKPKWELPWGAGKSSDTGFDAAGSEVVDWFFNQTMGIDLSTGNQEVNAEKVIHRLAGFLLEWPIAISFGGFVIKLLGAERASEAWVEKLGSIGQDLGLSWLIGNLLTGMFEAAVLPPIEEKINRKYHPARMPLNMVKALLKQHAFSSDSQAEDQLRGLGYRQSDIDLIKKLDDKNLSVGDIQQLVQHKIIADSTAHEYFMGMGYSRDDANRLKALYIDKMETQATSIYRTAIRDAYGSRVIDRGTFITLLKGTNVDDKSATLEADAIDMRHRAGMRQESAGEIKTLFVAGKITETDARVQLGHLDYDSGAINDLISLWQELHDKRERQIPVSRLLSYQQAGILSPAAVISRLVSMGYRQQDAQLMSDHPSIKLGGHTGQMTIGTIKAALRDQLIGSDAADTMMKSIGIPDAERAMAIRVAVYGQKTHHKPSATPVTLSKSDLAMLLKVGTYDESDVHDGLVALGYTDHDALILSAAMDKNAQYGEFIASGETGSPTISWEYVQRVFTGLQQPPTPPTLPPPILTPTGP